MLELTPQQARALAERLAEAIGGELEAEEEDGTFYVGAPRFPYGFIISSPKVNAWAKLSPAEALGVARLLGVMADPEKLLEIPAMYDYMDAWDSRTDRSAAEVGAFAAGWRWAVRHFTGEETP